MKKRDLKYKDDYHKVQSLQHICCLARLHSQVIKKLGAASLLVSIAGALIYDCVYKR